MRYAQGAGVKSNGVRTGLGSKIIFPWDLKAALLSHPPKHHRRLLPLNTPVERNTIYHGWCDYCVTPICYLLLPIAATPCNLKLVSDTIFASSTLHYISPPQDRSDRWSGPI